MRLPFRPAPKAPQPGGWIQRRGEQPRRASDMRVMYDLRRIWLGFGALLVFVVVGGLLMFYLLGRQTSEVLAQSRVNGAIGAQHTITECNTERLLWLRVVNVGGQKPQSAGVDSCGVPRIVWPVVNGK